MLMPPACPPGDC